MTVATTVSDDKSVVTLRIKGRFDFNIVQDFRQAYSDLNLASAQYIVDLAETEYMDSSALGMLLHLWKFAGNEQANINIVNASPGVKKIFDITHFDKKFNIK